MPGLKTPALVPGFWTVTFVSREDVISFKIA
jgi:hypothetical protein